MDKKSPSSSQRKGNLYRSLLMPGFTDAGFGTAYVPAATITRRTTATSAETTATASSEQDRGIAEEKNEDSENDAVADDTFSEAVTEIHDNRTKNNRTSSAAHRNRYYRLTSPVAAKDARTIAGGRNNHSVNPNTSSNDHGSPNEQGGETLEAEATYGFFPSTKPPTSPSPRRMMKVGFGGGVDGTPNKAMRSPQSGATASSMLKSPSPRPVSPPSVTRKQLAPVKRSSSTAAVVEDEITKRSTKFPKGHSRKEYANDETDVRDSSQNDEKDRTQAKRPNSTEALQNSNTRQEEQNFAKPIPDEDTGQGRTQMHVRPLIMKPHMKREMSTFSLAPETGAVVEREEHQANLKRWKEREEENTNWQNQSTEGNPEGEVVQSPSEKPLQLTVNSDDLKSNEGSSDPTDVEHYRDNAERRLDMKALQEMDAQNENEGSQSFGRILQSKTKATSKSAARHSTSRKTEQKLTEDDELSVSSSIVSSTCSEFGTVIQMGEATLAKRMAEVEEMERAALAEESMDDKNVEQSLKSSEFQPSSIMRHGTSLHMPILESSSFHQEDEVLRGKGAECQSTTNKVHEKIENNPKSNPKRSITTSEIVSAAFRRMGNIQSLHTTKHGGERIKNSLSAPTTPMSRAVQSSDESVTGGGDIKTIEKIRESGPPSSFLLRSPGSSARFSLATYQHSLRADSAEKLTQSQSVDAGSQSRKLLNPRFASLRKGMGSATPISPRVALANGFQYAQKCLSYDNTIDEYALDNFGCDENLIKYYDADERRRTLRDSLGIPPLESQQPTPRLSPRVLPLDSMYNTHLKNKNGDRHRSSRSLDFSTAKRQTFRPSFSTEQRYQSILRYPFPQPTKNEIHLNPSTNLTTSEVNLRGRIHSDFSPTKFSNHATTELLQPQRIQIEREDALDILACLVEQGIVDWKHQSTMDCSTSNPCTSNEANRSAEPHSPGERKKDLKPSSSTTELMSTEKEEKSDEPQAQGNDDIDGETSENEYDLRKLLQNFRTWCESDDTPKDDCSVSTQRQIEMLDELMKSHSYAVEMKRASLSASAWLKSIGRGHFKTQDDLSICSKDTNQIESNDPEKGASTIKSSDIDDYQRNNVDKMDLLTLRATLHSTQLELDEAKEAKSTLNEELSKCRAEIGRLKTAARSENVDKSMIDSSEKSNDDSGSSDGMKEGVVSASEGKPGSSEEDGTPADHSKDFDYERFQHDGSPDSQVKERVASNDQSDIVVLIDALETANDTIRKLYEKVQTVDPNNDTEEEFESVPVVDIPEVAIESTRTKRTADTPDSPRRTVNVRMLDGENFVTDWIDLRSLPPPPDHGLRSPIVAAVLEQWTQNRSIHEELLSWIERVMKGDDLEGLPPLKISSLNHQVRDGFSMHVLPHLLRRADIHVAVQTRAHRQTTYDMSVTVSQKTDFNGSLQSGMKTQPQASLLDSRDSLSEDEWTNTASEQNLSSTESVAHSAVTEPIANLHSSSQMKSRLMDDPWSHPPQTPTQTEYSNFPSRLRSRSGSAETFEESSHLRPKQTEQQNGTIMGALGGALSGLLSRNKYALSPGRFYRHDAVGVHDTRDSSNMLPASLRAQMDLTSSPTSSTSGYHRLGNIEDAVSASIDGQHQRYREERESYHRVVSAPPGRIGMTFVEFRGHAMVSDVAVDSPLAGWVFPSDVLVAIDNVPVSGMRVRDIVNILSNRKDRHRAMRVISSQAMNEFTMMSQGGGPIDEEQDRDD